MTLNTKIRLHGRTDHREVFVKCNQLIGAHEGTRFRDEDGTIMNEPDQGLPGWLMIHYRANGPLRTAEEAAEHETYCDPDCGGEYHQVACYLEVSLDTAYSYRDELGGCGDMHARFVATLGKWLDGKRIRWSWENEFTGEVHEGTAGLDELGQGGAEASAWMAGTVLPVIAARFSAVES